MGSVCSLWFCLYMFGLYRARVCVFRWYGSGVYALRVYVMVLPVHVGSIRVPPCLQKPGGSGVYGLSVYLFRVYVMVPLTGYMFVIRMYGYRVYG